MITVIYHSLSLANIQGTPVFTMQNDAIMCLYKGDAGNHTLTIFQHHTPIFCVDILFNNSVAHRIPFYSREKAYYAIDLIDSAVMNGENSTIELMSLQEENNIDIEELIEKANKNEAKYQFFLGMRYLKGEGVKQDEIKAAQLFATSAQLGNKESQYIYGSILQQGIGVANNMEEAIKWYQLAISQNEPHAMLNLSSYYLHSKIDIDRGCILLRKAAYLGLAEANVNLGVHYLFGLHTPKNSEIAYSFFKKAAIQFTPAGLYWYGWMHLGILPERCRLKKAKAIWQIGCYIDKLFLQKLNHIPISDIPGQDYAKEIINELRQAKISNFATIDLFSAKRILMD